MSRSAEAVICGAGIAGISAAYHLAVHQGLREIILVEAGEPLSLTSDKSTECYRNWWPGPGDAMVRLMNRSIDLMEDLARESQNAFHLSRRGYLYLTGDPGKITEMRATAEAISALGAGALRTHTGEAGDPPYQPPAAFGFENQPDGADLILDPALLHHHFPYLTEKAVAGLHVRRAGWFSAQQLGAYLLEKARACGVSLVRGRIVGLETTGGRVSAVRLEGGEQIATHRFVNAAGPMQQEVARMLGQELPVYAELHLKASVADARRAVPREAPLLVWTDAQYLPWSEEERQALQEDPETQHLLVEFPSGAHTRPEGGPDSTIALMLWEYRTHRLEPAWPLPLDMDYPEIVLRGLSTMLPALAGYFDRMPRPTLDGGYYVRTRENRPLICPLPVEGAYLIGALSGFGLMAGCAAGELLAAHLTGASLPQYAPAFSLERYNDPDYLAALEQVGGGQL